jgi:hypothetical protein
MATTNVRRRVSRRVNLDIDIDERTVDMSTQALLCRGRGHRWEDEAMSRRQTMENLKSGIMEYRKRCRCGQSIREVWSIRERVRIVNERKYPKGGLYKLPPGSGRLNRADAWAASLMREVALL